MDGDNKPFGCTDRLSGNSREIQSKHHASISRARRLAHDQDRAFARGHESRGNGSFQRIAHAARPVRPHEQNLDFLLLDISAMTRAASPARTITFGSTVPCHRGGRERDFIFTIAECKACSTNAPNSKSLDVQY